MHYDLSLSGYISVMTNEFRKHRAPQGALRRDRLTDDTLTEVQLESTERHKVH